MGGHRAAQLIDLDDDTQLCMMLLDDAAIQLG